MLNKFAKNGAINIITIMSILCGIVLSVKSLQFNGDCGQKFVARWQRPTPPPLIRSQKKMKREKRNVLKQFLNHNAHL